MAFSLIEKTDLLKKVRLPSEKAELQSALDSGGDKAKWFYDEKKFSWPQGQQIVLKASASVIKDLNTPRQHAPLLTVNDTTI